MVLTQRFYSAYQRYFADFLYTLINARAEYYRRSAKPLYYTPEASFFLLKKHTTITIPKRGLAMRQQLTPAFFNEFKKYYLPVMADGRGSIISQLLTGTTTRKSDIKKMLQKITHKDVIALLQSFP